MGFVDNWVDQLCWPAPRDGATKGPLPGALLALLNCAVLLGGLRNLVGLFDIDLAIT